MSVIGSMIANLKAKTAVFDKKMGGSRKHIRGMKTDFSGLRSTLIKATAAFTAFLGVRKLISTVNETRIAIDVVGKFSDQLGIATERLKQFEFISGLTGISIETLHKGLQIMTRRLGEAKQGYGEGIKGLETLGLKADFLIQQPLSETFIDIADAISLLPTQADKVGAAFALFGRQGVELLNFLQLSRDTIEELSDEADRLGFTLTKIDVAKVEAANDAMFRMETLITGIKQRFTISLAPFITAFTNKIVDMGIEGGFATNNIVLGLEKVSLALSFMGDIVDKVILGWIGFKIVVKQATIEIVIGIAEIIEGLTFLRNLLNIFTIGGFGIDIPAPTVGLRSFVEALNEDIIPDIEKFIELSESLSTGEKITAFFDDLQLRAQLAAEEMAALNRQYIDGLNLLDQLDGAAGGVGKSTIRGTFNAALVGALGFGSPMEQIRITNEIIAQNTETIARQGVGGGFFT